MNGINLGPFTKEEIYEALIKSVDMINMFLKEAKPEAIYTYNVCDFLKKKKENNETQTR